MGYYNSFIVRIWSEDGVLIRGTVEHAGSRERLVFRDPGAIIPFIHSHLGPPPDETEQSDRRPAHS